MTFLARLFDFLQPWRRGPDASKSRPGTSDVAHYVSHSNAVDDLARDPATQPEAIAEIDDLPAFSEPPHNSPNVEASPLRFELVAHIQGLGDRKATDDGWAGRASGWGKLEGFTVTCDAPGWREYTTCQFVQTDRSLSPEVGGGGYCGTRGKMVPLHGFVMHVAAGATRFADVYYQGVFQDNFRSGLLTPGTLCVSPTNAPLLAMRFTTDPNAASAPEYAAPPATVAAALGAHIPKPQNLPARSHEDGEVWDEAPSGVHLVTHISGLGDTPPGKDGWAGDAGSGRSIEGFFATNARPDWSRDVLCHAVLPDGSLGAAVPGGQYCGTRGRGQALSGFMLAPADSQADLAGITYEGVFRDGFHSPKLSPGEMCVSPTKAPLVAMHISVAPPERSTAPNAFSASENIRLVIWDLDETFWGGTLTEGGIVWREENAQAVRELARRGIVSSICSKNEPDAVFAVLEQHGMRDQFVFPSINWDTKGPRLAALIDDIQLRAPSVLFIDDNPLNRAEAVRFVPGLNVWDEHCLTDLLNHERLQGKPDSGLKRLEQYRLLERRHADRVNVQGDTSQFLRDSDITVYIEHDIEPHIDRAVELINRTNQLNFTKSRLPDDLANPDLARNALRKQLAAFTVQAGLLHVRDRYGDYGFCGFYAINRDGAGGNTLLHFAFSCRILGMAIEAWLFRRLKRQTLLVVGEVVTNVFDETPVIDWVHVVSAATDSTQDKQARPLRYVVVRGACDMRALAHYFTNVADEVIDELQLARSGKLALIGHSLITSQALRGMPAAAIEAFAPLGFLPEDFDSALGRPAEGPGAWLFGFNLDMNTPIYRHIKTAAFLPAMITGLDVPPALMMKGADPGRADPEIVAYLRENFIFFGQRPDPRIDDLFRDSLRVIFAHAGEAVRVFVLLSNTHMLNADGSFGVFENYLAHNAIIEEAAAEFPNVELLVPQDFMTAEELLSQDNANHFDRIVYFRIFQHIMSRLQT